jgi:hypothetical protein
MKKLLVFLLCLFLVTPAVAENWQPISQNPNGNLLLGDTQSVKLINEAYGNDTLIYGLFKVVGHRKTDEAMYRAPFEIYASLHQCMGPQKGKLIIRATDAKAYDGGRSFDWTNDGNSSVDRAAQALCEAGIGLGKMTGGSQ